jgi:hypothetical protein
MDFMAMVRDKWIIFLVIGLFLGGAIFVSELNRRSEKKKELKAQSASEKKIE